MSQMEGTVCSLQRQRGVEECIPLLTLPDPRPGLQSVSSSCRGVSSWFLTASDPQMPPLIQRLQVKPPSVALGPPHCCVPGPASICEHLPLTHVTLQSAAARLPTPLPGSYTVSPWPFPSGSTQNACVCLIVLKNPDEHFLQEASLTSGLHERVSSPCTGIDARSPAAL